MINSKSTINPPHAELEWLLQPRDEREKRKLENRIRYGREFVRIPVWNNSLLENSERKDICDSHHIPYTYAYLNFDHVEDAGDYICGRELKRDDLTSEYKKYLIGKEFIFKYKKYKRDNDLSTGGKNRIAHCVEKDTGMSQATVLKYSCYAEAIDYIIDNKSELAREILMSKLKVSHENILELARVPKEELDSVIKNIKEEKIDHLTYSVIRQAIRERKIMNPGIVTRRMKKDQKLMDNAGIRKMPTFDPDADIKRLSMTIPFWVDSIEKALKSTDYTLISRSAMLELVKKLTILQKTIDTVMRALGEEKNYD